MGKIQSIVVLTGAGISAESGLKTFRGADGLWENHPVQEVASYDGYLRNPKLVQRFYNERRQQLKDTSIQPNAAHEALAEFESQWFGNFLLVTQNVDNLHDRAGSKRILHMHGELTKIRCQRSGEIFDWLEDITDDLPCQCCGKTGTLRPHIVWFGEMPLYMREIQKALAGCDLFVSIGTSGNVYPAAGFVRLVSPHARRIEMNLEATPISPYFEKQLIGPASKIVPEFFDIARIRDYPETI